MPRRPTTCRETAAAILGRRACSVYELGSKLAEKGYDDAEIEATIAFMLDYRYLDDEAYAADFAKARAARGQGFYRIRQELNQRGIDSDIVERVLAQLPDPDDTLQKLLKARLSRQNDETTRQKAAAALSRRGYSWDDIHAALRPWED